jgi:hypothetical protein
MKIYYRLTREHLYLDGPAKMRNHLANEVLDKNMLHLMQTYANASGRSDLQPTIDLLEKTSILLANFKDTRPVRSTYDERLQQNKECLDFFVNWKAQKDVIISKNFITRECFSDLQSMVIGFQALVEIKLSNHPTAYVSASRTNTDIVENFFCSHRGINGSNNNPTSLQYAKGINTILISRKLISTRSNAGGKVAVGGAKPFKMHVDKSFKSLRL